MKKEGLIACAVSSVPRSLNCHHSWPAPRGFFERDLEWLQQVRSRKGLGPEAAEQAAVHMVATLEGAMILARAMGDAALFDAAAAGLS